MKETKEVLDFVISLGNAVGESARDGEIDYSDVINFWEPISKISDAVYGSVDIPGEMSDLTSDQMAELVSYVKEKFDIPQENVEEIIEDSLSIGLSFISLIGKVTK